MVSDSMTFKSLPGLEGGGSEALLFNHPSTSVIDSEEDDDFEGGDNRVKNKDDIDIEDEEKIKNIVATNEGGASEEMTL